MLTWTCMPCGERRSDAQISVHKVDVDCNGFAMALNIRYCNDRDACYETACKVKTIDDMHFLKAS